MPKDYFEKLTGKNITAAEYDKVNVVSIYHPSKVSVRQIAAIYQIGGRDVLHDMYFTASKFREMDIEMKNLRATIKEAQKDMIDLKVVISEAQERLEYLERARNS